MYLGCEYKTENEGNEKEVWPLEQARPGCGGPWRGQCHSACPATTLGTLGTAVSEEGWRAQGLLPGHGTVPKVHEKAEHRALTG